MDLNDIARLVAKTANADFAFVLSQAGLLVTHDAPRDMPDKGRTTILWACPSAKNGEIVHLDMPREDLVPYGGAAPVDVFATRVEDTAILVVVVASWTDKRNVVLALASGAEQLSEMIRKAQHVRSQKGATRKPAEGGRRERSSSLPAEGGRRERSSSLPAEGGRRERPSSLPKAPKEAVVAKPPVRVEAATVEVPKAPAKVEAAKVEVAKSPAKVEAAKVEVARPPAKVEAAKPAKADAGRSGAASKIDRTPKGRTEIAARLQVVAKRRVAETRARIGSTPEIVIGEAPVGRETMVAIEASSPRPRPGSSPDGVRVELASIGRETLLDIERIEAAERVRAPTIERPLVLSERGTLPWVEAPAAAKRSADAKAKARAVAAPEVQVVVEEMDPDALERAMREDDRR